MIAAEVRAALVARWPDDQYLTIPEAPDGPTRTGRKLDLLVVALWASKGYEIDGVEIKVSIGDWHRELRDPLKSHYWRARVHRFWIAVPVPLAVRVRRELPAGWGLLACSAGGGALVVTKPAKTAPRALTWPESVGLMRASADAGFAALERARRAGYQDGLIHGRTEATGQPNDALAGWR